MDYHSIKANEIKTELEAAQLPAGGKLYRVEQLWRGVELKVDYPYDIAVADLPDIETSAGRFVPLSGTRTTPEVAARRNAVKGMDLVTPHYRAFYRHCQSSGVTAMGAINRR